MRRVRYTRARHRPRRTVDIALAMLVLAFLALIVVRLGPPGEVTRLAGLVRVIDGDTLVVLAPQGAAVTLRLAGIDAPEARQTCRRPGPTSETETYACGQDATRALGVFAGQARLHCDAAHHDRYGRRVGWCRAGDADVAALMVRAGHAVALTDYHADERAARRAGAGLWAGDFDRPADWRAIQGDASGGFSTRFEEALERWLAFVRGSRHADAHGDE